MHDYLSTACFHGLHGRCRRNCKFCDAPCNCACHVSMAQPPECLWCHKTTMLTATEPHATLPVDIVYFDCACGYLLALPVPRRLGNGRRLGLDGGIDGIAAVAA
jgi:hypothetical protein